MLSHLWFFSRLRPELRCLITFRSMFLYLGFTLATSACLPLDSIQPECFPEESCPINFSCVEGRCVEPKSKVSHIYLNCLGQQGCYDQLVGLNFERACLFIEQPESLFAVPFSFDQARENYAELSLALEKAPIRASVMLLASQDTMERPCPNTPQEIRQKRFLESCEQEQGCLLRLRTLTIPSEKVLASEPLEIRFDGSDGQCIESIWRDDLIFEERCGAMDLDCDGFIDEGLICEDESL